MSKLDSAFLKAYTQQETQGPASSRAGGPHARAPRTGRAATSTRAQTAAERATANAAIGRAPAAVTPPQTTRSAGLAARQEAASGRLDAAWGTTAARDQREVLVDTLPVGPNPPHAPFRERARATGAIGSTTTTLAMPAAAPAPERVGLGGTTRTDASHIAPTTGNWQPMLEVSQFVWPKLTTSLTASAAEPLAALVDEIKQSVAQGRRGLLVVGCRPGDGTTTVALTLARFVASQKLRVALVDADFLSPGLATNLGVAADVGWEDVLRGAQPLAEALIESLSDRVTLLPLRQGAIDLSQPALRNGVAVTLDTLCQHFELVLVDGGAIENETAGVRLASLAASNRFCSTLVIQNDRSATEDHVRRVGDRLSDHGFGSWNIVRNFAA